jgi:hypothetical protein
MPSCISAPKSLLCVLDTCVCVCVRAHTHTYTHIHTVCRNKTQALYTCRLFKVGQHKNTSAKRAESRATCKMLEALFCHAHVCNTHTKRKQTLSLRPGLERSKFSGAETLGERGLCAVAAPAFLDFVSESAALSVSSNGSVPCFRSCSDFFDRSWAGCSGVRGMTCQLVRHSLCESTRGHLEHAGSHAAQTQARAVLRTKSQIDTRTTRFTNRKTCESIVHVQAENRPATRNHLWQVSACELCSGSCCAGARSR